MASSPTTCFVFPRARARPEPSARRSANRWMSPSATPAGTPRCCNWRGIPSLSIPLPNSSSSPARINGPCIFLTTPEICNLAICNLQILHLVILSAAARIAFANRAAESKDLALSGVVYCAPTNCRSCPRLHARRLLPFLFILYIANYLDRTNLAYAALEMVRDLRFTDQIFGIGAGIFFIGYLGLQIPGALLVEHWSARRWIAAIMIVWGAFTVLTAAVHTAGQLYGARFLLGAAEAGF